MRRNRLHARVRGAVKAAVVTLTGVAAGKACSLVLLCLLASMASGCRSPRPDVDAARPDPYYQRMITSGHAAFERGDIGRAAELYENAWTRAQVMDRPVAIAASAYNLALCRIALGDLYEGRALLQTSQHASQQAGRDDSDARIAEAEVTRRMGDSKTAWDLTDSLLAVLEGRRARSQRVQLHTVRALIALEEDDVSTAQEEWEQAENDLRRDTPARLQARAAEVQGRIRQARGELLNAAGAFDRETELYRNAGRFPDMARAMIRAADAYHSAGQDVDAVNRYYRAARHFAAEDQPVEALRQIEKSLPLLEQINDPALEKRVGRLVEQLSERARGTEK